MGTEAKLSARNSRFALGNNNTQTTTGGANFCGQFQQAPILFAQGSSVHAHYPIASPTRNYSMPSQRESSRAVEPIVLASEKRGSSLVGLASGAHTVYGCCFFLLCGFNLFSPEQNLILVFTASGFLLLTCCFVSRLWQRLWQKGKEIIRKKNQ